MSVTDRPRVAELFAGVGGFRIGLEGAPGSDDGPFRVVWANQWEPSTKAQHAAWVYADRWGLEPSDEDPLVYVGEGGDVLVNKDIATIDASDIPDHELLCGGFPCQDYSVAKTLPTAKGIAGVKGVLWWEIHRIIEGKQPPVILLENVDRLLKSPAPQRGRDFAVMLASLDDLGYVLEWRVIDASEYGLPQRRKRVFILGYAPGTPLNSSLASADPRAWLGEEGVLARAFPVEPLSVISPPSFPLRAPSHVDLADISDGFNSQKPGAPTPFENCGMMSGGTVWTSRAYAHYDGETTTLGSVLVTPGKVPDEFILDPGSVTREKGWIYLKGAKKEKREGRDGFTYRYSEGPVTFPDALDRPSRTVVTGEGGTAPSRFKHVVAFRPTKGQSERLELDSRDVELAREALGLGARQWLRRLTPIELERLNGFPDDHTIGPSDPKRAFFMGNALVCGVVFRMAQVLSMESFSPVR